VTYFIAAAFALFLIGSGLWLVQLWLEPWTPQVFFKLLATDGVLLAVVLVGGFVFREKREADRLRNDRELR
jgi:uncharacterized membrane protein YcjF (UPF0283 family)